MSDIRVKLPSIKQAAINMRVLPMAAAGFKTREYVQNQLDRELDRDGRKMPRYSPRWQAVRKSKGLPPGVVDLTITGHMLRSIDNVKIGPDYVKVGFNNAEAKRSAIGVLRNEKRPIAFMGLSDINQARLTKWFSKFIFKKL